MNLLWQDGGVTGLARVPHEDEARQLDTPLWGSGRVGIGRRQHSLLSKFYQCYIALAGWRGGRATKSAYQDEARQLHTLLWGSGRVEIATRQH